MRAVFLSSLVLALATGAAAQTMSDAWEEIGRFNVRVADTADAMITVRDRETGESSIRKEGDRLVVTGVTPDAMGDPGVPVLTVSIPLNRATGAQPMIELREADRVLVAGGESGMPVVVTEVLQDAEGRMTFAFLGELAVMAPTADGGMAPVTGAVPARIAGAFIGSLPAP